MSDNSQHARFSPSSLELFELCPCFMQEQNDSQAAQDGTRLHLAVEKNNLELCQTEEEEDSVMRCIGYLDERIAEYKSDCLVTREKRLTIEDMTEGTGDIVIVSETKADLIDWKFGRNPVTDAENNVQMQGYTLGVFHEFPQVQEVLVSIVQPRTDTLSTATYKRSDMERIRSRIQTIIERCLASDKEESASAKACQYCGRKAECPRMAETALTVHKNTGLPLPIEFQPGHLVVPEDRARAQVLSYILEDWAKQIRKYNSDAVIEEGIEIPGFELKSRKGTTSVVDVFSAVQLVLDKVEELSLDDILQACSLSIPKLVDQAYAKAQVLDTKETKKAIRENINELLKEHVSEPETITFLQRKRGKTNEAIIEECT